MNPALFYRGKDKTILPADLVATYLTYHANKAEDMKLLFKIRLIEREEKLCLREIKWRKHQLEAELKEQAEYYFGCHRVFSDQSLVSTSDSFKKNLYLGPCPTKALIPNGRLKELREKLRSMSIGNKNSQALVRAKLLLRRRQTFPSLPPESVHDIPDNLGVIEPTDTLVSQESKTDTSEQPSAMEKINSLDLKPENIDKRHDSLHEIQKLKFKRIQSAPMAKHSREKAEELDLDGRPHTKQKSKVKVRRAKTCIARRERLSTSHKFEREPYSIEKKKPSKQKTKEDVSEKPESTKERPSSDRRRKAIGKRPRPKSSPFLSALPKHLVTSAQGPRARSAISSRQKQKESDREEQHPKVVSKVLPKALDTKSSSLSGDERTEEASEGKKPGILRMRTVARLDFSKAHRLVCKSFTDSDADKTGNVDDETIVSGYLDESSQLEERGMAEYKQRREKRGSKDEGTKSQKKETEKTRLEIKIPQEECLNVDSEITESKAAVAEKRHTEKRESVSYKDAKRHSIKRWVDAVGHVIDHVDSDGECKRFVGHQAKKQQVKKQKLSIFKKRNFSDELKGKQSEVESDMRRKVLEFMKVYQDEEEDKDVEAELQENEYQ